MSKKWQVYWDCSPFSDFGLSGFVERVEQMNDNNLQVKFLVHPDFSIEITEVLHNENNEWQQMPKNIKDQIEREAELMFDAYDEGYRAGWG